MYSYILYCIFLSYELLLFHNLTYSICCLYLKKYLVQFPNCFYMVLLCTDLFAWSIFYIVKIDVSSVLYTVVYSVRSGMTCTVLVFHKNVCNWRIFVPISRSQISCQTVTEFYVMIWSITILLLLLLFLYILLNIRLCKNADLRVLIHGGKWESSLSSAQPSPHPHQKNPINPKS